VERCAEIPVLERKELDRAGSGALLPGVGLLPDDRRVGACSDLQQGATVTPHARDLRGERPPPSAARAMVLRWS
jgi:hypothetical protein